MTATIEARGVVVRAGTATLLRGVDLEVRAGEVVALVGRNGAGKSTLLAALAGDHRLARGQIRIAGRDVTALDPRALAALRAVLRQRSHVTAAFTALEVVQLGQLRRDAAAARRALGDVELAALADRSYPTLSGGEQQRVQLARVLAQLDHCPGGALLLDEPTAALDLRHRELIGGLARRAAAAGRAVVAVLHDLELAARCADRVVILAAGAVLAGGPPAAVLTGELLSRAFDVALAVERTTGGALAVVPAARGVSPW